MTHAWSLAGWYYKQNGRRLGPQSEAQVQQDLDSGRLRPTDLVWQKWTKDRDWKLIPVPVQSVLEAGERGGGPATHEQDVSSPGGSPVGAGMASGRLP